MPSNKVLEEKKLVVENLAQKMKTAQAGVLVKYEGITVAEDTALRAALRKAGVEALAATPSKEVLIAKMMGSLMSSLYSFAYVLQAKIDKENDGATADAAESEAEKVAE